MEKQPIDTVRVLVNKILDVKDKTIAILGTKNGILTRELAAYKADEARRWQAWVETKISDLEDEECGYSPMYCPEDLKGTPEKWCSRCKTLAVLRKGIK